MPKSVSARIYVALMIVSGFLLLGNAILNAESQDTIRFIVFLVAAALAARCKVKLPGLNGTMSVNLPFILIAAAEMGAAEALTIGFVSTLVQCLPKEKKKFNVVQIAFNCSAITLAVEVTRLIYVSGFYGAVFHGSALTESAALSPSLRLVIATAGYFMVNTLSMAVVVSLTESLNVVRTWIEMLQLSFPYVVASAGVAGVALTVSLQVGWQLPIAVLPIMVGIFQSYRRYFSVAAEKVIMQARESRGTAMGVHA
jgi:hypothetical protein